MELLEKSTAKAHGKLMIATATLSAVLIFSENQTVFEVFSIKFSSANAYLVMSIIVVVFWLMWKHRYELDDNVNVTSKTVNRMKNSLRFASSYDELFEFCEFWEQDHHAARLVTSRADIPKSLVALLEEYPAEAKKLKDLERVQEFRLAAGGSTSRNSLAILAEYGYEKTPPDQMEKLVPDQQRRIRNLIKINVQTTEDIIKLNKALKWHRWGKAFHFYMPYFCLGIGVGLAGYISFLKAYSLVLN